MTRYSTRTIVHVQNGYINLASAMSVMMKKTRTPFSIGVSVKTPRLEEGNYNYISIL